MARKRKRYLDNETGDYIEFPWDGPNDPTDADVDLIKQKKSAKSEQPDYPRINADKIGPANKPWYERLVDQGKVALRSGLAATVGDPWNIEAGQDPGGMASMIEHPVDSLINGVVGPYKRDITGMKEGGLKGAMSAASLGMNTIIPGSAEGMHMFADAFGSVPEGRNSDELVGADKFTKDTYPYNGDNSIVDRVTRGAGNIGGQVMLGKLLDVPEKQNMLSPKFEPKMTRQELTAFLPDEATNAPRVESVSDVINKFEASRPKIEGPETAPWKVEQLEGEPSLPQLPDEIYKDMFDLGEKPPSPWKVEDVDMRSALPEMSFAEKVRRVALGEDIDLFDNSPSSQRGALGEGIDALNKFEDSQHRKYGKDWRVKQSVAEDAFHKKLLQGSEDVSYGQVKEGQQGSLDTEEPIKVDDIAVDEEPLKPVIKDGQVDKNALQAILDKAGYKNPELEVRLPEQDVAVDLTDDVKPLYDKKSRWVSQENEPPVDLTDQIKPTKEEIVDVPQPTNEPGSLKEPSEKSLLDDITDIPKTLKSAFDLSFGGRQGLFLANRSEALKGMGRGLKSVMEKHHESVKADLANRPNAELYKKSGLQQVEYDPQSYSGVEEQFPSKMAEKLPGVKQSERIYIDQGNLARANVFDSLTEKFSKQGKTPDLRPDLYKGMADYLNVLTGRKALPEKLNKAASILNKVFWSPRFVYSRMQMLNPNFYRKLPREIQLEAIRDIGGTIAVSTTLLAGTAAVLKSQGVDATYETDPRHTDFGKLKVGKVTYDLSSSLNPLIRTASRMATGTMKTPNGEYRYNGKSGRSLIGMDEPNLPEAPFGRTALDEGAEFLKGKLAPVVSVPRNYMNEKGYGGEKYGVPEAIRDTIEPMSVSEFRRALMKYDTGTALATLPGFVGASVNVDIPDEDKVSSKGNGKSKKHKKTSGNYFLQ